MPENNNRSNFSNKSSELGKMSHMSGKRRPASFAAIENHSERPEDSSGLFNDSNISYSQQNPDNSYMNVSGSACGLSARIR